MKSIFKLISIELNGIKNVEFGKLVFQESYIKDPEKNQCGVTGIYGQNGSGKTAAIDTFSLLKSLALQIPLNSNSAFSCLINRKIKKGFVNYCFEEKNDSVIYNINYQVNIEAVGDTFKLQINEETLEILKYDIVSSKKTRLPKIDIVYGKEDKNNIISSASSLSASQLFDSKSTDYVFLLANLIAAKTNAFNQCKSFLFSDYLNNLLDQSKDTNVKELSIVLSSLKNQIQNKLAIYTTIDDSVSNMGIAELMADNESQPSENGILSLALPNYCPFEVPEKKYDALKRLIKKINMVIPSFVPGFKADLNNLGSTVISKTKETGYKVELMSVVDGIKIPMSAESGGIKKLISICIGMIHMYNDPSFWLIVDELDSGVFEYLLGQVLKILSEEGLGQLIFTCHNCRPLEILDKKSIYFSTTNPKNRYIHLINVKESNNIRDYYIRAIQIGGQKEELYKETNDGEISHALRESGKILDVLTN